MQSTSVTIFTRDSRPDLYVRCLEIREEHLWAKETPPCTAADYAEADGQATFFAALLCSSNELVGTCMLHGNRLRQCLVLPNAQQRGSGRALVHAAASLARDQGATELTVSAWASSASFYERCGFVPASSGPYVSNGLMCQKMTMDTQAMDNIVGARHVAAEARSELDDDSSCLLFADDGRTAEVSAALQVANEDLDSRGTLDAAAECIDWEFAGTSVSVKQQAGVLSDTAALVWMEPTIVCQWLATSYDEQGALGATIDVGAGTGFLGLWTMRHGLCTCMTISDRITRVPFIRENMSRNHLTPPTTTALGLNWGDVEAARELSGRFDTVLAVGLIYDPVLHEPLIATLFALASPLIILSFARRHEAREEAFLQRLRTCYSVELRHHVEEPLRGNAVLVYECRKAAP